MIKDKVALVAEDTAEPRKSAWFVHINFLTLKKFITTGESFLSKLGFS